LCYRDFATHLGSDQPVYGLQSIGAHGKHHGHASIEAMATHYIQEIQNIQPEGPYRLVGWSLGGAVAYEMAQQLKKQDQQIGFLGLLDSDLPRLVRKARSVGARRFVVDFAHQCGLDSVEVLQGLEPNNRLQFLLGEAKRATLIPADLTLEQFRRLYERYSRMFRANVRALRRYVPRPLAERVVLLQARDRIGPSVSGQEGTWQALCESVEVHVVPGNHYTMICEPLVGELVDQIRNYLTD
jgi:thioesterase domain-containing protein